MRPLGAVHFTYDVGCACTASGQIDELREESNCACSAHSRTHNEWKQNGMTAIVKSHAALPRVSIETPSASTTGIDRVAVSLVRYTVIVDNANPA